MQTPFLKMFPWPDIASHLPRPLEPTLPFHPTERSVDALMYWLQFSDHFRMPHIIYFRSVEDLLRKLVGTNLVRISLRMREYNKQRVLDTHLQWNFIASHIRVQRKQRELLGDSPTQT